MGWFSSPKNVESNNDLVVAALNKSLAVIEFEPSGNIITANANFLNAMGYRLEEIQGQHHAIFVDDQETQSPEYQQFWQRLRTGEFMSDEFKRFAKNGKEIWIQATYNPIIDSNGNVVKVIKFASDITAQKELEKKSKRDADLSNALRVCQANVMIANNDLEIIFVNDQVQKMLKFREEALKEVLPNFSVDSLVGTCVDDFHKQPSHQREVLRTLTEPFKTTLKIADLIFSLIATPWLSVSGSRLGTIVEWQDITDSVAKAEAEKREAEENLRVRRALDRVATNTMIADAGNNIIT